MSFVQFDYYAIDQLQQTMQNYPEKALAEVNTLLHKDAGQLIQKNIQQLLPESGRTWSGKKTAASKAKPFTQDNSEMLAVTVKSKNAYHYLYFPDDGTNTHHHAGNQQFMLRGAEQSTNSIIDLCVGSLVEKFKE